MSGKILSVHICQKYKSKTFRRLFTVYLTRKESKRKEKEWLHTEDTSLWKTAVNGCVGTAATNSANVYNDNIARACILRNIVR
jgi:hypothetical protein